jgi:hypothetical protein
VGVGPVDVPPGGVVPGEVVVPELPDCTTTVPVMLVCRSQWNEYVPGVLNVQVPAQPGPVGLCGRGGTEPLEAPCVWLQAGVAGPLLKSTLCVVLPWGGAPVE